MKLFAAPAFALFEIFAAATAFGAAQPLVKATPVALATVHQSYAIDVRKPADVIVVKVKVPPGASFGWHSHPSAVAVAITSATSRSTTAASPPAHRSGSLGGTVSSRHPTTFTSPETKGRRR